MHLCVVSDDSEERQLCTVPLYTKATFHREPAHPESTQHCCALTRDAVCSAGPVRAALLLGGGETMAKGMNLFVCQYDCINTEGRRVWDVNSGRSVAPKSLMEGTLWEVSRATLRVLRCGL